MISKNATQGIVCGDASPTARSSRLYLISSKKEHILSCDRSEAYLFWLWNCRLMTSKLVPAQISLFFCHCTNIRANTHESTHKRTFYFSAKSEQQKKSGQAHAASHQFPSRWTHSQNLQSFCGSKYRNCQVEWKSIKKSPLQKCLFVIASPPVALFILVGKQFNKMTTMEGEAGEEAETTF